MTKRNEKTRRIEAIHWHDLPHETWHIEIRKRTQSAIPNKAFIDAERQHLKGLLEHNREIHGKYVAIALGQIVLEVRVASEIYKEGLTEVNQRLTTKESEENLRHDAVEYGVAPYAVGCLRRELERYLKFAKIPFERVQELFDPLWPDLPLQIPHLRFAQKASKSIAELLALLVPDDSFQGVTKGRPFETGGPFGIDQIRGKIFAPGRPSLAELLELHKNEMWWIQHVIFLWSGTLEEVVAQHEEVEIELYGRKLDQLDRTAVDKVIDLYAQLKPRKGPISDRDLAEVAALADSLDLKPNDILGKNGRKALAQINARRRSPAPDRVVNTVADVVCETKRVPECGDRSLRSYFTKFLSDRLDSRSPRVINSPNSL